MKLISLVMLLTFLVACESHQQQPSGLPIQEDPDVVRREVVK